MYEICRHIGMHCGMLFICAPAGAAESISLESYVRAFNYEARKDMKCSGKELLSLAG